MLSLSNFTWFSPCLSVNCVLSMSVCKLSTCVPVVFRSVIFRHMHFVTCMATPADPMSLSACVCIRLCVCPCVCVHLSVCLYMCMCLSLNVHVCLLTPDMARYASILLVGVLEAVTHSCSTIWLCWPSPVVVCAGKHCSEPGLHGFHSRLDHASRHHLRLPLHA